ncbi:class I SAM-dependent DNA methyltransferase [Kribbella sp. NPDC048928]|uniref:class I SAM-dependent DNA methyltransferase n=1 Tax=Kribbella sp. NPDC048928 TaxID=3364111 RepID=UPI003715C00D
MTHELVGKSEKRDYGDLFRHDLNWGAPDHPPVALPLEDGTSLTATNISSYKGLRVWEVPAFPGSAVEARMDHLIAKTTTNRLVIFHEADVQAWRWPSRSSKGAGVTSRSARHVHRTGSSDPRFADKLEAIRLPDDVLLDVNAVLAKVRGAFDVESKNETKRASKLMAGMYAAVEKAYPAGYDAKKRDHEISVSLARVLFLLFGDDTEMWTPDLFQDFVKDHTARAGSDVGQRFNELFEVLDTPQSSRAGVPAELGSFPYVNGGIFAEKIHLPALNQDFRDAILDACAVDWSTISPAIFGSMFQSVRDAQTRRELGEHYTSEENIKKTLEPLFLDELRAELEAALARDTNRKRLNALRALWDKLGAIRFMDPACGCGNFIITAYKQLRLLELDVMLALQELEGFSQLSFDPTLDLKVTLDHFYGIEIDEWPARIAETAMFLVDRQCDLQLKERFGDAPQRLPIQRETRIVVGSALQIPWEEVCPPSSNVVVAGNPPFLGHATRSEAQAQELRDAWGRDDISRLDYVTGWHAKALRYFATTDGLWAFVTTSSATQGDPVPHLFQPIFAGGWQIKFAHRTFAWESEAAGAAAVHCVIVGFARSPANPLLYDYDSPKAKPTVIPAKRINGYLADGPIVYAIKRSQPISPVLTPVTFGAMARDGGHLIVEPEEVDQVRADPIARKYLLRFIQARELLHGEDRWCLWMVDLDPADIAKSPVLQQRLDAVRELRSQSRAASTAAMAATPHLFGQRPAVHDVPFVGIPRHVSEDRHYFLVARFGPDVICGDANFMVSDPDGLAFALLSSSMFLAWQKTVGGRLESRLRFSNTIVWNNFPLPAPDPHVRDAIVAAGQAIESVRAELGNDALADLYPPGDLDPRLQTAHDALDSAVDATFGVYDRPGMSELERVDILFDRYAEMTADLLSEPLRRRRR